MSNRASMIRKIENIVSDILYEFTDKGPFSIREQDFSLDDFNFKEKDLPQLEERLMNDFACFSHAQHSCYKCQTLRTSFHEIFEMLSVPKKYYDPNWVSKHGSED